MYQKQLYVCKININLAKISYRFHAFSSRHVYGDMDLIKDVVVTSPDNLFQGGVPDGAGVREEVHVVWKEWEECRKNLAEVESIISKVPLLHHEHCKILFCYALI